MADKNGKKRSFRSFLNKYKLGSHHKMERFGIISIILLIGLFSSIGLGIKDHTAKMHQSFENVALYTTEAESSITSKLFTVDGLWCNTDKTRAYLLIHTDSADVSYNPEDFMVKLGTIGYMRLSKPISGNLFVFGNTGYIGLELTANQGFPEDRLVATFVLEKDIAKEVDEAELPNAFTDTDDYFAKHDAFDIVINPAGKDAYVSKYLDKENLTASDLYKVFITGRQEAELKIEMQTAINEMHRLQDRYNEDIRQLEVLSVKIPKLPKAIRGDSFVYNEEDSEWLKNNMANVKAQTYVDGGEEVSAPSDDLPEVRLSKIKPYRFKSAYTFSGGLDYEWHSTTVRDTSYIDMVVPSNMTFADYIDNLGVVDEDNEAALIDEGTDTEFMPDIDTWTYANGKPINFDSERTEIQNISKVLDDTQSTVSEWLNLKRQYQTDMLRRLLLLEDTANEQDATLQTMSDGVEIISR